MKHEHNAFENQIFNNFREKANAKNDAIELLLEHNYRGGGGGRRKKGRGRL